MVVVVALVLAFASLKLQPQQQANVETEMKGAILRSLGVNGSDVATLYDEHITDAFAVDASGERVEGADAFALLKNLKSEYDKPASERVLPVFMGTNDAGQTRYVLPLWGKGLWGPVWGYIALEDDMTTIAGAVFDHKSETPGLGAEIATPEFGGHFAGKNALTVRVMKAAGASDVDAISGGTITSRGVSEMVRGNIEGYTPYIEKHGK